MILARLASSARMLRPVARRSNSVRSSLDSVSAMRRSVPVLNQSVQATSVNSDRRRLNCFCISEAKGSTCRADSAYHSHDHNFSCSWSPVWLFCRGQLSHLRRLGRRPRGSQAGRGWRQGVCWSTKSHGALVVPTPLWSRSLGSLLNKLRESRTWRTKGAWRQLRSSWNSSDSIRI